LKPFNYSQPTEVLFGAGRITETGQVASRYGSRCLLVTGPRSPAREALHQKVRESMKAAGLSVIHFDGVLPNPTTAQVSAGSRMAREERADVVLGLGGGSSMDAAKAIAVEASHEGTCWDYLFYKKAPSARTLPIVCVTTTSGTGSQTTPCAVITRTEQNDKSALWHPNIFAKAAVVDPELMLTLPARMTAITGFDAFSHSFEAFISNGTNPLVEQLALQALRLIVENLPRAVDDGSNREAREALAWADTLGGMAIASAGVTLPHGLGMQVGGYCPQVAHGQALAALYPEFTRYTWSNAVQKFAEVGRIFNPGLERASDRAAAEGCCDEIDGFLKRIGMWLSLKTLGVSREALASIADRGQVLPDYKNNPRVATLKEMSELLAAGYERSV
jgi:alcohol dehydrogenase class IV